MLLSLLYLVHLPAALNSLLKTFLDGTLLICAPMNSYVVSCIGISADVAADALCLINTPLAELCCH